MKPAPAVPPRQGVTVEEEHLPAAIFRTEGTREKTLSSLRVFGCLPRPFAKRLLEAQVALAQEWIALLQGGRSREQR